MRSNNHLFFLAATILVVATVVQFASALDEFPELDKSGSSALWPLPRNISSGNSAAFIAPDFEFHSSSKSEILRSAFDRYRGLIFETTKEATKFVPLSPPKGTESFITKLVVEVGNDDEVLNMETDESYELDIPSGDVSLVATIRANSVFGALYGLETFSQLISLSESAAPEEEKHHHHHHHHASSPLVVFGLPLSIQDFPRFPHRGLLIDSSRHFLSKKTILKTIDGLAFSKMNILHWHIVDSQSFPFASQSQPSLKSTYGPHLEYSIEDVTDIVKYAKYRGVRVIPEFDVPGHTFAWGVHTSNLTVCGGLEPWGLYCAEPPCGQLDPTSDKTYEVVDALFAEVAKVFDDEIIHTGADEVNYNCWRSSLQLVERMAEMKIPGFRELLQHFETKLEAIIKSNSKKMMVWQEILDENITVDVNNTIIQIWKDASSISRALAKGYKIVVSPAEYLYLDCGHGDFVGGGKSWCDPYKTWQHMHGYDPIPHNTPSSSDTSLILGAEACMWTELVDDANFEQRVWPRTAAIGERLWSSPAVSVKHPLPSAAFHILGSEGGAKGVQQGSTGVTRRINLHRERLVARGISASALQPTYCLQAAGGCPPTTSSFVFEDSSNSYNAEHMCNVFGLCN